MTARGFAPILIILLVLGSVVVGAGSMFAYQKYQTKKGADAFKDDAPVAPNSPTDNKTPSPSSKTDETANWKTYETTKFSIKYPPTWEANNDTEPSSGDTSTLISLYSDDYKAEYGGITDIKKGFKLYLNVNEKNQNSSLISPDTAGVEDIAATTWLGKKAQIVKIAYEGINVRLESVETPKAISLTMFTPPSETPPFKTYEDNKKVFMQVANTLILK